MISCFLFLFFVGRRDFRDLLREVHVSRCNAFAQGSYSNLRTQVRSYFAFCVYYERTPLPADPVTIYAFAQFLSRTMTPSSVRNYLSGVKTLHILHGFSYNFWEDPLLQLELKGIARLDPHVPVRAEPITPNILLTFRRHMDDKSSLHSCVWACALFCFYMMARLGSILPSSRSTPPQTFLTRDRVNFATRGLVVTLLHTKTIQFGRRRLHIPLLKLDSDLCPVRAYFSTLAFSSSVVHGPAFVFRKNNKFHWLTTSKFIDSFRSVLRKAEVENASAFSGHSFRRGGATWAFQSGVPGELIQVCGDWASDSYKRYLEFSMSDKVLLAARLTDNLPR